MNGFTEKSFKALEGDITLLYCGKRINNPSHSFGPYDRDSYLLYYIKEGDAFLKSENFETEITHKGFFVNYPYSQNIYKTKKGSSWSIKWIAVKGNIIESYLSFIGISRNAPFMKLEESREIELIFDEMYHYFDKPSVSSRIYCISLLHKLFSLLADKAVKETNENDYITRAYELIDINYCYPDFNVTALSQLLGLHHNYFSVIFKRATGISPVKAIALHRLQNAAKMLKFTDNKVRDIAHSSGFSDEFYFSRAFKKHYKLSPDLYRKKEEYLT